MSIKDQIRAFQQVDNLVDVTAPHDALTRTGITIKNCVSGMHIKAYHNLQKINKNGILDAVLVDKPLQREENGVWADWTPSTILSFYDANLRVKPEPQYKPLDLKSAVDWVGKDVVYTILGRQHTIIGIGKSGVLVDCFNNHWITYSALLENYRGLNGERVGILTDE